MLDWDSMCEVEPVLVSLEDYAKEIGVDSHYRNYELMKDRMDGFVGAGARHPALRSCEAWDVAVEMIANRCAP